MFRFHSLFRSSPSASRKAPARRAGPRLRVEGLEDRLLLAAELVADINPGPGSSNPQVLVSTDQGLYFGSGGSLWRSDGTPGGTQLVHSNPGELNSMVNANGTLFFTHSFFASSFRTHYLFQSDGTTAGTSLVTTFNMIGVIRIAATAGDRIFLVVVTASPTVRSALWTSDGTPQGTIPLLGGNVLSVVNVNGTVFFSAEGEGGRELYKTDGTVAGTVQVKDINPEGSSNPNWLSKVGGLLYFSADDGEHGAELWVSDGTEDGTRMVADIYPGVFGSFPRIIIEGFGTYALFSADDGTSGREPWVCCFDGFTPTQIADINPGPASSDPQNLIADAAGFLYLSADDGTHGRELWYSDWTPAGTRLVKDVRPGPLGSDPQKLTLLYGYYLYFTADDGASGRELWASDGSEEFTVLDTDIYPGVGGSVPTDLVEMPDAYVYFAAAGPDVGRELFRASPFFGGPGGAPGGAPGGGALMDLLADAAPAVVSPGAAAVAPRREVRPEADLPRRAAEADLARALLPKKERVERLFAQEIGALDLLPE